MTITIGFDADRKLVVRADSVGDSPDEVLEAIKAACKPSTVGLVLIASNITFPAWRMAIIAIKPYLKPGAKVEQIREYTVSNRMRSANRHTEIVRGLL